ncbi:DNA polymerase III subunit gamma/tau [Ectobacillus antri]|uniref:DNA-directed DNA polymerase n=1 Tax=Ectobacillus antri TaxID=2486280 RepID=A0ABT6HA93_9BACI|nr:DNA polymerase III subunit gamma/tau [Ectobacillus antri]MDG4658599.1 DNA polymerase III subunit gamma/tau [Ectobacillus antri]MDG5755615.1 DNA polymerase III subunit gamma/tau [Ectobacillus antri]
MSYQALYRTWRPQMFEDVVGQKHVTKTLQNALLQQKVSHAYLFSGPRGTGKTTIAKVFAKAVNCEQAPTAEPCNNCPSCLGITDGTIGDVLEIDAASNNGVDEIRDIRDKVKYAPSSVRYKVYIIDEVHMLSIGAFNALLKTLEEPPKHVIFILATTEPHKIPPTIISRCQRFEFRKISVQDIVERLTTVVHNEHITITDEALHIVARTAEGGMRDALSLLDQAISYSENEVTAEEVLTVTGSVSQQYLNQLVECIYDNNVAEALRIVNRMMNQGKDPLRFMEDFIYYFRDMLLYQTSSGLEDLLERVVVDESFRNFSEKIQADAIYDIIHTLSKSQQEMKWTNHPRIFLEVVMVKLCQQFSLRGGDRLEAVMQRLQEMEHALKELKRNGVAVAPSSEPKKVAKPSAKTTVKLPIGRIHEVLKSATRKDLEKLKGAWGEVLDQLKARSKVAYAVLLEKSEPVAAAAGAYVLAFEYEIHCKMAGENQDGTDTVEQILYDLLGARFNMIAVPKSEWSKIREGFLKEQVEDTPKAEDPIVAEAIKLVGQELVEIQE